MNKIKISKKKDNFVILDTSALKDETLSWQAKGLHAYLMQLPNEWEIKVADLQNRSTNGRDSTATILKELIQAGYIHRTKARSETGKFSGYDYTVFEKPEHGPTVNGQTIDGISENGLSVDGKTVDGKPVTINNEYIVSINSSNNDLSKDEESKVSADAPPQNFNPDHSTIEVEKIPLEETPEKERKKVAPKKETLKTPSVNVSATAAAPGPTVKPSGKKLKSAEVEPFVNAGKEVYLSFNPEYNWKGQDWVHMKVIIGDIRHKMQIQADKNKVEADFSEEKIRLNLQAFLKRIPKWYQEKGYTTPKDIRNKFETMYSEIKNAKATSTGLAPSTQEGNALMAMLVNSNY